MGATSWVPVRLYTGRYTERRGLRPSFCRRPIDEPFFDLRHRPDLTVIERICARFGADDARAAPFAEVARSLES